MSNIDWSGISDSLFKGLGAALGGLAAFVCGLVEDAWKSVVKWWYDVAYEDGAFTMEGLLRGIWEAIKNIGAWIYDHIFKPFIDGFKEAFGIASPSTVMAEQGKYIIEGLLQGVTNAWRAIVSFFSTKLSGITDTVKAAWNGIKSTTATVWGNIKSSLSNAWNGIKATASAVWSGIKNSIVNQGWSSVGSNICNGIREGLNAGWDWLNNTVKNLASSLFNTAKAALGIHSPSKLFRDEIGLNLGYGIGEGIGDSTPSILKTVSGVANAIADEMNSSTYPIRQIDLNVEGNITRGLDGFSDTIVDSFASLLNRLQSIADNVTFATPVVAKNGVVPYSVRAEVDNGKRASGAFETSNDELIAAVSQAVAGATSAIVGAIRDYSGTKVMLDSDDITSSVIKGINQRTRMAGISPLK